MDTERIHCHTERDEYAEEENCSNGGTVSATQLPRSSQSPHPEQVMAALEALGKDISMQLRSVTNRLTALENQDPPSGTVSPMERERGGRSGASLTPASRSGASSTPVGPILSPPVSGVSGRNWADRPVDEQPSHEYLNEVINWGDEEEEEEDISGARPFTVSEDTGKLLKEAFTRSVNNATRKKWREKHGVPKSAPTRTPKLDKIVKDRVHPRTAKADRDLARLQTYVLDAVGPLTHLLEMENIQAKDAVEAAVTALRFLGNASVQISRTRRKAAITDMNPAISDMAEFDAVYAEAAPSLFGDNFCKEAKDREDQLKCLDRATKKKLPQDFRGGHTSRKGGGNHYPSGGGSGRSGYRFNPYPPRNRPFNQTFNRKGPLVKKRQQ